MKIFTLLIGAALCLEITTQEIKKCCNNSTNVLLKKRCELDNGVRNAVNLNCEKYTLNPHDFPEESYGITPNGSLHLTQMENVVLPEE